MRDKGPLQQSWPPSAPRGAGRLPTPLTRCCAPANLRRTPQAGFGPAGYYQMANVNTSACSWRTPAPLSLTGDKPAGR
ncbi:hypothetical protein ABRP72_19535 [Pectobacterium carotovorum]|uniref:hypothetical protein n=1 Tax=Pectobacterium carotovorum TaxID=554 RepID=UPI0032ECCFFA